MDLINTNSGNTLDKTISLSFNLLSSIKNDSIFVDYGDNQTNTLTLNSSKTIFKSCIISIQFTILIITDFVSKYSFPRNLSNVVSQEGTAFLLLNNEFRNQTSLYGFELYSSVNGSITLQVYL